MKKMMLAMILILSLLSSFALGYFFQSQPKQFNSCSAAYNNLMDSKLCYGKSEWDVGSNAVIGNVEWLDFNWDKDIVINGTGESKYYIGGIDERCFWQAERQLVKTGIRKDLINCFAQTIETKNNTLDIGCGCFFG